MTSPRASIRSAPSAASGPAMRPPATTTSRMSSTPAAGSTTRPRAFDVVADLHTPGRYIRRDERRRPHQRDLGPHLHEPEAERSGDAGVQHVPDDPDTEALEAPELLAHRVQIEEALRWMFVGPVAGVEHVR